MKEFIEQLKSYLSLVDIKEKIKSNINSFFGILLFVIGTYLIYPKLIFFDKYWYWLSLFVLGLVMGFVNYYRILHQSNSEDEYV